MAAVAAGNSRLHSGDARQVPPVLQLQRKAALAARVAGVRIDLGERRLDGGDVSAVAVQEVHPLEAVRGERPVQSRIAAMKVEGRSVMVPGKAMWCWAMPTAKVGATSMSAVFCASRAMISGQSQSVPSRPVGPCCSLEPIGMTTVCERSS